MKTKSIKALLAVVVFSIVALFTVNFYPKTASANEVNPLDTLITKFEMVEGASARLDAVNGIKFEATIIGSEYLVLEGLENATVSYGMIIAPKSYVVANPLNVDNLFKAPVYGWREFDENGELLGEIANGLIEVVNIPYDTLLENEDGTFSIKGSLVSIKETNLTLDLVGVAYVSYNDGVNTYYRMANYFGGDIANNSRSIVEVAQLLSVKKPELASKLNDLYLSKVKDQVVNYTVETYVGDTLQKSEKVSETINETVTVTPNEFDGLTLNEEKSILSGLTIANDKLTLKVVYDEVASYQVKNGNFETGDLTGWTISNEQIGAVSSDKNYWVGDGEKPEGYEFGLDGTYMFSNYTANSNEGAIGYLQSEVFTIGGSGWLTYKIGGAKNASLTYVDIIDNANGNIIKRLYNGNWAYRTNEVLSGCNLNAYKVDLSEYLGKEVYIKVVDIANDDYGLLFLDSFNALYACEPNDSFALAYEVAIDNGLTIYNLNNGSFSNDMAGWYEKIISCRDNSDHHRDLGNISENGIYWGDRQFNNNGKFYSAYEPEDRYEQSTGYLRSSAFVLGGSGWVTFGIGGIKNPDYIWVEVINVKNNLPIARYYNHDMRDCTLIYYKADLSAYIGETVYINIVDNATSDYGLIFVDEINTCYENEPSDYILAVNHIYTIRNGGFETGNLTGWTLTAGEIPGIVTNNANTWFGNPNNDNFYFGGFEIDGANREDIKGTLRSDYFMLKAKGWLTFKLGGAPVANPNVYVRVVNVYTGETMAIFKNDNQVNGVMTLFKYQFNNEKDTLCYIELYDQQDNVDGCIWRLLVVDSFVANASGEEGTLITNRC